MGLLKRHSCRCAGPAALSSRDRTSLCFPPPANPAPTPQAAACEEGITGLPCPRACYKGPKRCLPSSKCPLLLSSGTSARDLTQAHTWPRISSVLSLCESLARSLWSHVAAGEGCRPAHGLWGGLGLSLSLQLVLEGSVGPLGDSPVNPEQPSQLWAGFPDTAREGGTPQGPPIIKDDAHAQWYMLPAAWAQVTPGGTPWGTAPRPGPCLSLRSPHQPLATSVRRGQTS